MEKNERIKVLCNILWKYVRMLAFFRLIASCPLKSNLYYCQLCEAIKAPTHSFHKLLSNCKINFISEEHGVPQVQKITTRWRNFACQD